MFEDPSTVRDVTKVRVHNNVIWNAEPGNAIELGYALQSEIHDLVFEDCDIIHCQYEGNMGGAAISIHQADGGHVHDIHYKNIRVEQAEQKLFDIKVLLCKYTEQLAKGEINDIYFDNIQVLNGDIPVSMIRGIRHRQKKYVSMMSIMIILLLWGISVKPGRICGLLQNWQMTFMSMVPEYADR